MSWNEGIAQLERQAEWLEAGYPSATRNLREGLEWTFTVNRPELIPSPRRCFTKANLIESPHSALRLRTRCFSQWRDYSTALRWVAKAPAS